MYPKKFKIATGIGAWCSQSKYTEVLLRHGLLCWYCGRSLAQHGEYHRNDNNKLVLDHVEPRCRGGSDEVDNLVPSCQQCNCRKGRKSLAEYKQFMATQSGVVAYFFFGETLR